jgi:tetratricopeptide (TPR) repeat protein
MRRMPEGPSICLNMIVRNEAHVVQEVLDAVSPYIASWVIVDTGSDDGTQDVIRAHMRTLGIPGELHEREWRNFGHNRTEALELARGHGDYIWVIDADDMVVGTLDFRGLTADCYALRYGSDFSYWRKQVFRSGLPWRYEGVVHEYAVCDAPATDARLDGDYYIESRRLGGRNLDPKKYERDRDLLLAEVARNPTDARSAFYLAQSYYDAGDPEHALEWYRRRAGMGGWDEEVYYSLFRCGECQLWLGAPWPEVQDAFLRAWEHRPVRAEPLHALARQYRVDGRYQLGYLFAERAASIALPAEDALFVGADVYAWRARDEQAICAFWIGKPMESFALCRLLLANPDLPDNERERVAENRDFAVPALLEAASTYPEVLVRTLSVGRREAVPDAAEAGVPATDLGTAGVRPGTGDAEVTLTIETGADRAAFAHTLNSFLRCCVDVRRVGRFVAIDTGLSDGDRAWLAEQYPFVEVAGGSAPPSRVEFTGPYWLRIPAGWEFFGPERYVGRALEVFAAEPEIGQVGINVNDAETLAGRTPDPQEIRRTAAGSRYVLLAAPAQVRGPAVLRTEALDPAVAAGSGLPTASFDEILCVRAGSGATAA